MKFTEQQKNMMCDKIQKILESYRLSHFYLEDDPDEHLPLLDLLSSGETITTGKEEIQNIVEDIYFDMEEWEI